jgi:hypothetical protein
MGVAGAQAVASLLKSNSTLRHLDLGLMKFTAAAGEIPNRIGTEGAVAIANSLKYYNNSLCSLSLLNNLIFQDGMAAIRAALLDSYTEPSPTAVVSSSSVEGEGEGEGGAIQTMNRTLIRLDLEQMGVPFNELTREEIRLALRRNYLSMNSLEQSDAMEAVSPSHLAPIQSVYRVNGSYNK